MRGLIDNEGNILLNADYVEIKRLHGEFDRIFVLYNTDKKGAIALLSEDGMSIKIITDFIINHRNANEYREGKAFYFTSEDKDLYVDPFGKITKK